jgi:hypothetical protein
MSPARFLCAIPVEYHPQVSILCLPFNEKEITIKLSDIVSVLIVFDDKLPAVGVVLVLCFMYVRRLAMTSSFFKATEVMNSPDRFRSCDLPLIRR